MKFKSGANSGSGALSAISFFCDWSLTQFSMQMDGHTDFQRNIFVMNTEPEDIVPEYILIFLKQACTRTMSDNMEICMRRALYHTRLC